MARRPRIHFPGACYHVIVRRNNRQSLFTADADRLDFLALVAEGVKRFGHHVHAYCLMANHVHFAVQVGTLPLSKIIHNLSFRFARRMHRRLDRTGHFFERRYRAGLIETDRSLLNVVRYIHRNPVEAGLVGDPGEYRWSSHRVYVRGEPSFWLTTGLVLQLCSLDERAARIELARVVDREPLPDEEPWIPERLLGEIAPAPALYPQPRTKLECGVEDVVAAAAQIVGVSLRELQGHGRRLPATKARALAALIVRDHSKLSLRELAERLDRSPSTISCLASRAERLAPDPLRQDLRDCLGLLRSRR